MRELPKRRRINCLNPDDVRYIRRHYIPGVNSHDRGNAHLLAKAFNISTGEVCHIAKGRCYKWVEMEENNLVVHDGWRSFENAEAARV